MQEWKAQLLSSSASLIGRRMIDRVSSSKLRRDELHELVALS